MKLYFGLTIVGLAMLGLLIGSCIPLDFYNPAETSVVEFPVLETDTKIRILEGQATPADLSALMAKYNVQKRVSEAYEEEDTDGTSIIVPETGKLMVTLRDNDAGWQSKLYMMVDDESILLFEDTREGPLDVTSEYQYEEGTEIEFYLVTTNYAGDEWTTYSTDTEYCQIDYLADDLKWIVSFEDNPSEGSDIDFNDCVIEVEMAPDPLRDISECFDIEIEYLNPAGYTAEGYTIYYIGDTMYYNVYINLLADHDWFEESTFVVYAIHEYYEDTSCDRYWYPSPPRPASEPQFAIVEKGEMLPGQNPPQKWENVQFTYPTSLVFEGSYMISPANCTGNDQTHIIIVREVDGDMEVTVYDNPEAGVFDPPPTE